MAGKHPNPGTSVSYTLNSSTICGKSSPYNRPRREVDIQLYSFSTSALERGGWSAPCPGHFTPGKDPVPTLQEAGWAPGPACTSAKNLAPTGI
jgi:hypothetical protein